MANFERSCKWGDNGHTCSWDTYYVVETEPWKSKTILETDFSPRTSLGQATLTWNQGIEFGASILKKEVYRPSLECFDSSWDSVELLLLP